MVRKLIEKSCLYINSKCPDKDVDVTMLVKDLQNSLPTESEIKKIVYDTVGVDERTMKLAKAIHKRIRGETTPKGE